MQCKLQTTADDRTPRKHRHLANGNEYVLGCHLSVNKQRLPPVLSYPSKQGQSGSPDRVQYVIFLVLGSGSEIED